MAKRARQPKRGAGPAPGPGPAALAALVVLGAANAAWAGFQWWQLVVARGGGEIFCALGGDDACTALWDSAFAAAVRSWTGLPVAAWGVVWSLAALALPLVAALRTRRGRSPEPWWSATLVTALGGLGAVAALGIASLVAGAFCPNCALTYLLVVVYAAVCLSAARGALPLRLPRGTAVAGAAIAAAFLALLYPGLRTPRGAEAAAETLLGASAPADARADTESELFARIERLSPAHRQALADAVAVYRLVDPPPVRPPRALHGAPMAPVRITHFSDFGCPHCKSFHEQMEALLRAVPEGSVSIESRVFPLDSRCNPYVEAASGSANCLAAYVSTCLEQHPRYFELEGRLFDQQHDLTEEAVYEIASEYRSPERLRACVASEETRRKIADNIEWAMAHDIHGTPLVLVNGRRTDAFLPFLYAMVMTGGDASHAVFQDLPAPRASAGLHDHGG